MGSKIVDTRRIWAGVQEQWDGLPPLSATVTATEKFRRTAVDNPSFKSTIRAGANATNNLVVTNQTLHYKPGLVRATWVNRSFKPGRFAKQIYARQLSFQPTVHTTKVDPILRSSVFNAAKMGIIKKIRTFESSDFAGPTFTGELRETISMIKSPLKSLRLKTGLFTDLHMRVLRDKQARGKRFKPEPWRKVLSDTYLEWTFGAAPLISDIAGIAQLSLDMWRHAFPEKGLKRLSYRFSDSSYDVVGTDSLLWPNAGTTVKSSLARHGRCSVQYVVWIDQNLLYAEGQLGWLARAAKFDLGEILPTAWELMPWSFLIDYFTNIGDLMACTFDFNRNVKFGKETVFDTCTLFHTDEKVTVSDPTTYQVEIIKPHVYTSQYTEVTRYPVNNVGFPSLAFSLPNIGQASNILALVVSLSKNDPFRGFTLK